MSKIKKNYLLVASGLIPILMLVVGTYNISQNTVTAQEEITVQNNISSLVQPDMNFSSSINVNDIVAESLKSKVTTTLSDAIGIAEANIGEGAFAKEASLETKHGYLVYKVKVSDSANEKYKVIIDPGTGEVLKTEKVDYEHYGKMGGDKYGGDKYGDKNKKDKWSR
ncbi:MAG: PepSY domain-containing protein [Nitrososphaeraceae archaeon]